MGRTRLTFLAVALAVCALPVASAGAMPAQRADRALDNALARLVDGSTAAFVRLRRSFEAAVCAALATRR
jgi:hypothetical protein